MILYYYISMARGVCALCNISRVCGVYVLYVIINTQQKNSFSPMKVGSKIGKTFSRRKFPAIQYIETKNISFVDSYQRDS